MYVLHSNTGYFCGFSPLILCHMPWRHWKYPVCALFNAMETKSSDKRDRGKWGEKTRLDGQKERHKVKQGNKLRSQTSQQVGRPVDKQQQKKSIQTDRQVGRWVGRNHNHSMDHNGSALQPYVGGPNDVFLIASTTDAFLDSPDSHCFGILLYCVCVRVCERSPLLGPSPVWTHTKCICLCLWALLVMPQSVCFAPLLFSSVKLNLFCLSLFYESSEHM